MSFKPIDAKRDEFRKYLERTGALEAISKVFIKLIHFSDRPENAIDFICANLGSTLHQNDRIEDLQRDLEDSKDEIAQLKQIIENLKAEARLNNNDHVVADKKNHSSDKDNDNIHQQNDKDDIDECTNNENKLDFLTKKLENISITSAAGDSEEIKDIGSNASENDVQTEENDSESNRQSKTKELDD